MWNRGGVRSAALERAKAQLSGERVNTSGTAKKDVERHASVTNFGKSFLQDRQSPLQGLSDLSSEDAEGEEQYHQAGARHTEPPGRFGMGGGSRFLKKPSSALVDGQLSAPRRTPSDTSDLRPVPQRSSQSVALSRLAVIEDRIRNHKTRKAGADTDPGLSRLPESGLSIQSSSDLSMTGSRFLKKRVATPVEHRNTVSTPIGSFRAPSRVTTHIEKGIDSNEEDMRKLLGESLDSPDGSLNKILRQSPQIAAKTYRKNNEKLSSSSVLFAEKLVEKFPGFSVAQHHKSPSPSPPSSAKLLSVSRQESRMRVSLHSLSSASSYSEIKSLEELFPAVPNNEDTLSEMSEVSDDFKLNVMMLDDLAPVTLGIDELPKVKTHETSPGFRELSPFPADETSQKDRHVPEETPAEYESDFESEIQTETALSANEISEHRSDVDKHSYTATEPQSRSDESHTDDEDTLSDDQAKSSSILGGKSESSLSRGRNSPLSAYSSDATITQSEPRRTSVRRPLKDATVQTQRDGLSYSWSCGQAALGPSVGMSYVDPTPVASHTISAEAVEALSAYSPAVFALNDMLRQQLSLTRSFIESSRHLHQAMVESLGPADYRYTTLEETKKFIHTNRSPKLTVEDALEQVLQEMREYHYI